MVSSVRLYPSPLAHSRNLNNWVFLTSTAALVSRPLHLTSPSFPFTKPCSMTCYISALTHLGSHFSKSSHHHCTHHHPNSPLHFSSHSPRISPIHVFHHHCTHHHPNSPLHFSSHSPWISLLHVFPSPLHTVSPQERATPSHSHPQVHHPSNSPYTAAHISPLQQYTLGKYEHNGGLGRLYAICGGGRLLAGCWGYPAAHRT